MSAHLRAYPTMLDCTLLASARALQAAFEVLPGLVDRIEVHRLERRFTGFLPRFQPAFETRHAVILIPGSAHAGRR